MLEEVAIQCPHCGETITLVLDLSEGDQSYVEDCAVCSPILVNFSVDEDGPHRHLRRQGLQPRPPSAESASRGKGSRRSTPHLGGEGGLVIPDELLERVAGAVSFCTESVTCRSWLAGFLEATAFRCHSLVRKRAGLA
jgi:hypothetical protein